MSTKQEQIHRLRERTYGYWREGWGEEVIGGFGVDERTLLCFKMDSQLGPTAQHTELCSVLRGSLDGWAAWGRMGTYICVAESLCCAPETIATLVTGSTLTQTKKLKK